MSVEVIDNVVEVVNQETVVSVDDSPDEVITLTTYAQIVTLVPQDQGIQGPPGPAGPPGPQGVSGDAYFVYNQIVAATTWGPIIHNLGKHPAVSVVDSGDNVVYGDVHYIDNNSLTVSFAAPFGGTVYCD